MHFLIRIFSLLFIFAFLLPEAAIACLGVFSETRTFLDSLPANAMSKSVVARVKIVASKTEKNIVKIGKKTLENDSKIIANAKVIKAVKGTQTGSAIKIEVVLNSCSREPNVEVGQTYYIAGAFNRDGTFQGQWKNSELESK